MARDLYIPESFLDSPIISNVLPLGVDPVQVDGLTVHLHTVVGVLIYWWVEGQEIYLQYIPESFLDSPIISIVLPLSVDPIQVEGLAVHLHTVVEVLIYRWVEGQEIYIYT